MGKGDQRSRKGKIYRGTFGKSRPRKPKKTDPKQEAGEKQQDKAPA